MRYAISDQVWAVMGPIVERHKAKIGPPPLLPDRMFFEAVLYVARTGIPWRDLPAEFGAWDAVYNRLRRWIYSRRLEKLFRELVAQPACEGTIRVMVDSTLVRAHQHAAGAPKKRAGRPARRSAEAGAGSRRRSSPSSRTRTA
jgi:transposase